MIVTEIERTWINKKIEKEVVEDYEPIAERNMFDIFTKALKMDKKGSPRSTIINELKISSATFYKWIKNPKFWADKYQTTPLKLSRTTKEIIVSLKKEENSMDTVRGIVSDLGLEDRELDFIYHYIHRRNATEAMLRALPPEEQLTRQTAKMRALLLLQKPSVRMGLDRVLSWELEGIHVTLKNDIIGSLYRMAFYDPGMFIDGKGNARFMSLDDIPEEYRCCVTGIKTRRNAKNPNLTETEIQLADRTVALKELSQYGNLYEDNSKGLQKIGKGLEKIAGIMAENKMEDTIEAAMKVVSEERSVPS